MRKFHLCATLLLLIALPSAIFAGRRAWKDRAVFVPPSEPGKIFVVINYDRSSGHNQGTFVNVDWGTASRKLAVVPPYRQGCADAANAGFVLRMRHPTSDSVPMTVTTTGTIVRGPFQGDTPLEVLSACYKLVS
jgi:hypothetical protein